MLHLAIVDDHKIVRAGFREMLADELGIRVEFEAASGEEGIAHAAAERFDIVFLDLTMPGLSGSETASVLRASSPDLPIVFVSGYSREMAETGGVLAGEVFVQKPFDAGTLMAAAAEAMERRASV